MEAVLSSVKEQAFWRPGDTIEHHTKPIPTILLTTSRLKCIVSSHTFSQTYIQSYVTASLTTSFNLPHPHALCFYANYTHIFWESNLGKAIFCWKKCLKR